MERQSGCSSPPGSRLPPFGAWNAAKTPSEMGWLLADDAVEVDDPIGWEPLIPAGIPHETVLLTAQPFLP
jgi:hypothetical protein